MACLIPIRDCRDSVACFGHAICVVSFSVRCKIMPKRMQPDEITAIIHAAPEIAEHGAELVGALKLTDIGKAILGDAAGEFAERIRDSVRLYRFGNQLKLLKKAEKMIQDAGFKPKAAPIKLLFPLLEGASLEADESLHNMWAALLANACSTEAAKVRPGFVATLKQMAPDEAQVLEWVHKSSQGWLHHLNGLNLKKMEIDLGFASKAESATTSGLNQRLTVCIDRLEAMLLIRRTYFTFDDLDLHSRRDKQGGLEYVRYRFDVTNLGHAFMEACRPPSREKNS